MDDKCTKDEILKEVYSTYLMLICHPEHKVDKSQEFVDRVNGLAIILEKEGYEL